MLAATSADIIFIVDESGSMTGGHDDKLSNELLKSVYNSGGLIDALHTKLGQAGVVDVRYGLVAYGGDFIAKIPPHHDDPNEEDGGGDERRIDPVFQGLGVGKQLTTEIGIGVGA